MRSVFSESIDEVRLEGPWPGGRNPLATSRSWRTPPNNMGVLRWLRSLASEAATDLVTAFFPTDCLLCAGPVTSLGRERLCQGCIAAVQQETGEVCARCGEALGMESARFAAALHVTECTACRLAPPAFVRAASYAAYEGHLRELLHLLKFGEQRALADRVLGPWLASAMLVASEGRGTEFVVVPVPMFSTRERRRGFNQAALLAGAAVRHLRKSRADLCFVVEAGLLERHRDTGALFALSPHQRRRSLKGAFRVCDPVRLRGREVMLVDDIMTTGATARECARVLLAAGASAVLVATVARAQPEGTNSHAGWTDSPVARWDAGPRDTLAVRDGSVRTTH